MNEYVCVLIYFLFIRQGSGQAGLPVPGVHLRGAQTVPRAGRHALSRSQGHGPGGGFYCFFFVIAISLSIRCDHGLVDVRNLTDLT